MKARRSKVFGIGLNKTGTTTLGVCMKQLGYNHLSHSQLNTEEYSKGNIDKLIDIAGQYDSFDDWPWPLMYKDLAEAFPDAKFVLTMRKSAEVWLESLTTHSYKLPPKENYHKLIYGYKYPATDKRHHLNFYDTHNSEVISYFESQPGRLLVVNWELDNTWDELCEFLNEKSPAVKFPHAGPMKDWHVPARRVLYNHLLARWELICTRRNRSQ